MAVSQVVDFVPQYSAVEAYVCVGWGFVPVVESCPQEAKAMYVVQCFSVGGALDLGAGGSGIGFAPPQVGAGVRRARSVVAGAVCLAAVQRSPDGAFGVCASASALIPCILAMCSKCFIADL